MYKNKINHPEYYNIFPIETIDIMIKIWGEEKVKDFCIMNAFKYRMRVGYKDDVNQDLQKEQWYLLKAKELEEKNRSLS